jgi:phosphofructokinase-like protein
MVRKGTVGILTGGGDCPGINAAIRAVAKALIQNGDEVIGIRDGWQGFFDQANMILDRDNTSRIIDRGGTILGTSRTSPLAIEGGIERVFAEFKRLGLVALVVIGGEGTLSVTSKLFDRGLPVIGIPKTIDNDVKETDYAIGFQTAVQIATDALDRLRSTAESHHRVMLLEVMGRATGWIATYAGMANGAEAILIPEAPLDEEKMDELCRMLVERKRRGKNFSLLVVAEGTEIEGRPVLKRGFTLNQDGQVWRLEGFGGIGQVVGGIIRERTGLEVRVSSLDYIQRGGTPVAYDRSLATAFGVKAAELVTAKRYGEMTALRGNRIMAVPLSKVADGIKTVPLAIYRMAEMFFG